MPPKDPAFKTALDQVIDACNTLPMDDRLLLLEGLWLAFAGTARGDALAFGLFTAERDRQVQWLEKMIALVRDDEPDLELQEYWERGDFEGAMNLIRRRSEALEDDERKP